MNLSENPIFKTIGNPKLLILLKNIVFQQDLLLGELSYPRRCPSILQSAMHFFHYRYLEFIISTYFQRATHLP